MSQYFSPYEGGRIHIVRPGAFRITGDAQTPVSLCSITTNSSRFIAERPDDAVMCKRCLRIEALRAKESTTV